jgi:methyltransferase-like protein
LPFPTQIVPESFSVQILDNPGNKPYPLPKCLEHRTLEYRQQQALKEVIDFTVDNTNLKGGELIKAIQHNVAERLSDQTKKEELLKDEALSQSIKQYLEEKQTSYLKKLSNYIMAKYNGISVKKYKQQQITNLRHKMVKHHGLWASREKLGKPSMSEISKGR